MTLVLTCLTKEYVLQVSDRRLTWPNGRVADDNANKAVLLANQMAFAYTGRARVGPERTDVWLAHVLRDMSHGPAAAANGLEVIVSLGRRATEASRGVPLSQARLAFVAAGFARLAAGEPLRPYVSFISNALTDQLDWLPAAEPTFVGRTLVKANDRQNYFCPSAGERLLPEEVRSLSRSLRRIVDHETGPEPAADVMVETIRKVAKRTRTVGEDLLVNCLPRAAAEAESWALRATRPNLEGPTFLNVVAGQDDGVHRAPHIVILGGPSLIGINFSGTDRLIHVGELPE